MARTVFLMTLTVSWSCASLTSSAGIPWPAYPAAVLPDIQGSAFPPYRTVFQQGECTANDFTGGKPQPNPMGGGPSTINTNKTCFSCFRIPTLLGGQTPGVIHAFAEARRGELTGGYHQYVGSGAGSCPDGPDTRLAYKRSEDYGANWSPVKIFLQPDQEKERAENGLCQSQAAPFIDPSTKTLFVAFNQNGPSCQTSGTAFVSTPMLVNSTDDGLSWSKPYSPMLKRGGGLAPVPAPRGGFVVGPTKGLTARAPGGGVRLMIPGEDAWSASVYSDDHGRTWDSNFDNRSLTLSPGEMDWTICPAGASCPAGMKYAMINRGGAKASPDSCQISFSADSMTWSRQVSTDNGDLVVGTHHGKPGLVAVPGALLSSQQISNCPKGRVQNHDYSCGTPGTANFTQRQPSDVVGSGMGLLISKDGVNWKLFKKLWPFGAMYTTLAALTVDAEGAATTYSVVFAGGSLPVSRTGAIFYMNFTAVHPNGTMDFDLAAAIANL